MSQETIYRLAVFRDVDAKYVRDGDNVVQQILPKIITVDSKAIDRFHDNSNYNAHMNLACLPEVSTVKSTSIYKFLEDIPNYIDDENAMEYEWVYDGLAGAVKNKDTIVIVKGIRTLDAAVKETEEI